MRSDDTLNILRAADAAMDAALLAYSVGGGYLCARRVAPGTVLALMPLTFGRWRLVIGREDDACGHDDGW